MTIAEEINDLKSRVSAAFSACAEKSASMPETQTTWTLANTIKTIPSKDTSTEDALITRTVSGTYENSRVTSIGSYIFASCTRLTTVSFPQVTTIGASAFASCTSLTTVSFPQVTTIGSAAFASCTSLTTVSFPQVTTIGTSVFRNCSSLTKAIIGGSNGASAFAFNSCKSLSQIFIIGESVGPLVATALSYTPMSQSSYLGYFGSIYVRQSLLSTYQTKAVWSTFKDRIVGAPTVGALQMGFSDGTSAILSDITDVTSTTMTPYKASLTHIEDLTPGLEITTGAFSFPIYSIGSSAFYSCPRLTTAIFPNVTSFGSSAFYSCPRLTTAIFPNLTSVGSFAFMACYSLTTVSISNAKTIGTYAFNKCSALTTVSFPNVTSILSYAFYDCNRLLEAIFPNVTSINTFTFTSCSRLTIASFPNAKTILSAAFQNCYSLASVYFRSPNMQSINSTVFANAGRGVSGGFHIYVPTSLVTYYQGLDGWSYFSSRILPFDDW